MELDLEGVAVAFVETELERLEKELKSLHSQLPPFSSSDEIQLLSVLKAALGEDDDVSSHNVDNRSGWEMFDLVPPTLDAFARNSGWRNPLDRYTSGLLLQLKLRFFILIKDFTINNKSQATKTTTDEGQEEEDEDINGGTPTPPAADETHELPIQFGINDLMPSDSEQQERRQKYMKAKHKEVKEETESKLKLVLELRNVSTEEEADFLRQFHILLERRLEKLLWPKEDEQWKLGEGTRKRLHPNREEDELTNSHEKKLPAVAEAGRDDYIKGEMNRLAREYERLMKQHLAAFEEPSSMFSHPSSVSVVPPQPVDPPLPPPTVSIAIHLGWNYTNVGWIPPSKSTAELLCPPIPCLIGFNEDQSEVLYGSQVYEALGKTLPSQETGLGSAKVSSFLNLKSILRGEEVEWRKGKAEVRSELPLAMFLIHVKRKIEAAIPPPSSSIKYKVILVLPQVLSIVQRGRISDAAKLAGFGEDQVHLIKETTAAALAFAHDADIWSPGSMLPIILVCCRSAVYDSNTDHNNADAAIFSNEDGILTMGESTGRQGLGQMELRKEIKKFQRQIAPFAGEINKNSVIVHLDDDGSSENVPCSLKEEMEDFRALLDRVKRPASESDDLLNKIHEHLTTSVRCFHCLYDSFKRVYLYLCPFLLLDCVDYRNVEQFATLSLHQWSSGVRVAFLREPFGSLLLYSVREGIVGVSYVRG
jgi:hypothetical protein